MLHTTSPDTLAVRAIDPALRASASTRITAVLLIVTGAMSLAPMPILGPAIGWPASLDDLPARQLGAIGQAPAAVAAGYSVYLLYSLLVLPAFALAAQRLLGGFSRSLVLLVVAFAALSTLARSVGILRWLTVMPELSRAHAVADAAGRERIELVFSALNRYGGGIGELLGVSLFAALAVLLLAAGAGWARATPRVADRLGPVRCAGAVRRVPAGHRRRTRRAHRTRGHGAVDVDVGPGRLDAAERSQRRAGGLTQRQPAIVTPRPALVWRRL